MQCEFTADGPAARHPYTLRVTPFSAVLITKDEERRLPDALASVSFCDEVLVVDAGSSDRTREVAAAAGARVIVNQPWPGFLAQRNFATAAARHDWILALDADERLSPPLREELAALRSSGPTHAGYLMPRVARYLGREIRATDWYPDWQLRLFDRRRGRWVGTHVHESFRVDGPVKRLSGEIEHRSFASVSDHLRRIDAYTTLWAEQSFAAGRRAGAAELLLAPGWAFARNLLLRGGFRLGTTGLLISSLNAYYVFAKLAKLYERQQQPPQ
jgi:glycosyltransferase involved in cell wall biosynthesis